MPITRPTQSLASAWLEESAVAAIVLDHEEPHQKPGGRYREQQAEPVIAEMNGAPHQEPQQDKRPDRDGQFDDAAGGTRCAITGKDLRPAASVGYWCG